MVVSLSTTKAIAAYAADARHPPSDVVATAKLFIADTFGCILAGTGTDTLKILAESNKWTGQKGDVPVIGWGYAKTFDSAAQMLGTAAHAYDFDDTSLAMPGHPSAPIVAALLATVSDLAESKAAPVSGLQFIHAYIKGVEVTCRIGELLGEEHKDQGWHTISTVGLLGAAVACASLRGLGADKCERALAIAGSHACGLLNNSGTMVKPLHCGISARAAYMAAAMAEANFTANEDVLHGGFGFVEGFVYAFTAGRRSDITHPPVEATRSQLPPLNGSHFEVCDPGMEVKRYPCCQVAHVNIDAILRMRAASSLDPNEIERIVCYVSSEQRMRDLQCPEPKSPTEARFSMNFNVAVALVYGEVTLDQFNPDLLASYEFDRVMRLVDMRLQDKTGEEAVDVEVILKDGRRITGLGTYEAATWSDIVRKFENCAKYAARPDKGKALLPVLKNLDAQENFGATLN